MIKILTALFLLTIASSCDSSTKFTEGKFYNELEDCQKSALNLYDNFEEISLESYRNDSKPYLEKGSQVFDLVNLLSQAERKNQTIIFYFNGHGCQNCRVMEQQILNKPEIDKRFKNDFLFIPLTVDDKTLLPVDKQILLSEGCRHFGPKRTTKRIGDVHVHLQVYLLKAGSQPYFYAFDANSELEILGYVKSVDEFNAYLDRIK